MVSAVCVICMYIPVVAISYITDSKWRTNGVYIIEHAYVWAKYGMISPA